MQCVFLQLSAQPPRRVFPVLPICVFPLFFFPALIILTLVGPVKETVNTKSERKGIARGAVGLARAVSLVDCLTGSL